MIFSPIPYQCTVHPELSPKLRNIILVRYQHVHFSTRALILGNHKMGTQIYQPIFELFLKLSSPVQNLLFEFFTGIFIYIYIRYPQLRFKMRARFVSSGF